MTHDMDGGNAAAVMAALDQAQETLAAARAAELATLGVSFAEEWEEEMFSPEELEAQSFFSRLGEAMDIKAKTEEIVAPVSKARMAIQAITNLVGVGVEDGSDLGSMIRDISFADALDMSDSQYETLAADINTAVEGGDFAAQTALTEGLLRTLSESLTLIEDNLEVLQLLGSAARRVMPDRPLD